MVGEEAPDVQSTPETGLPSECNRYRFPVERNMAGIQYVVMHNKTFADRKLQHAIMLIDG